MRRVLPTLCVRQLQTGRLPGEDYLALRQSDVHEPGRKEARGFDVVAVLRDYDVVLEATRLQFREQQPDQVGLNRRRVWRRREVGGRLGPPERRLLEADEVRSGTL